MSQFKVYRNPKRERRPHIPYLLDVQAAILDSLPTRLVAPLVLGSVFPEQLVPRLHPNFRIEQHQVVLSAAEIGAVAARDLREEVVDLSTHRDEIMAAIDLLFIGY